jgi:hypothetical protein
MTTTAAYLSLITSEHRNKPRFIATVTACVSPFAKVQGVMRGLTTDFDLDLAIGKQLDILGLWIGKTREISEPIEDVFFSWRGSVKEGWRQGSWRGAYNPDTGVTVLDDDAFRALLKGKALANIWKGTVEGAYASLDAAVGHPGSILITDNCDMTMSVGVQVGVFSTTEEAIIKRGYIPIRPAGVLANYYDFVPTPFEIYRFRGGSTGASELIFIGTPRQAVRFDASTFLICKALTPFFADAVFEITKNGTTFATATIPAGGSAPVAAIVSMVGDYTDFDGATDELAIYAPSTVDPDGGNVLFSILGTLI